MDKAARHTRLDAVLLAVLSHASAVELASIIEECMQMYIQLDERTNHTVVDSTANAT